MQGSFAYTHEDEDGEKTFDLTYDFTPDEREVRWGHTKLPPRCIEMMPNQREV